MNKSEKMFVAVAVVIMAVYFFVAEPDMMDDGLQYEGFTESLARGQLDFKSFYGFQGLSILSVPVFWLTGSDISIIITSAILYLLSLPLAYLLGRDFYSSPHSVGKDLDSQRQLPTECGDKNKRAGVLFMSLMLLIPYTYTTMMRGFQEAALLFFVLLTIYSAINKKIWTPIVWAFGGIVKPFNLVLAPLFIKDYINKKKIIWIIAALIMGILYLGASYYQTGHLINNAAIGSYQGNFDNGNPPPLIESFVPGIKGFLRVGANLLLHFRKILISPLIIALGGLALLKNKNLRLRQEIILAILLNFILVGTLTYSFSKYILPMVVLFALCSVPYLLKYKWLMALVIADSLFVFWPIWDFFGKYFWSNIWIYLLPIYLAIFILLIDGKRNSYHRSDS